MRKVLLPMIAAMLMLGPLELTAETVHVATVTGIVDGDTLTIDPPLEDGNEIRLVGIQAPKLPLGRAGFETWPLAPEAKQALSDMTLGKRISLGFGGTRRDRYGRWLAHLHVVDNGTPGLWVQGEMLRLGMARVYSFPDNRSLVNEMLALEREARSAGRGIWTIPYYAIRGTDPDLLKPLDNSFQLVEGRVASTAKVKGWTYLNFGADWRTDFTIAIRSANLGAFAGAFDPLTLDGRAVRVRGWMRVRNGPMIDVTHPEQIELLPR